MYHFPGGGVLPMWWVIHMCRGFDPLFSLWQDRARSFWGVFSHPPTQKRSFGYKSSQNSIFLAPKYHFSLDLFGSNFQWPAAHPQQFSDRVPPPGPFHNHMWIQTGVTVRKRLSWVVTSVTLTFDLWPWPFAWTSLLSLVITPENFMMIGWWEHSQKGVTDRQTDRRTDGRTDGRTKPFIELLGRS